MKFENIKGSKNEINKENIYLLLRQRSDNWFNLLPIKIKTNSSFIQVMFSILFDPFLTDRVSIGVSSQRRLLSKEHCAI